ncbi:MAG: Holliday junction branch migration protein RuvA [Rhodospirillaceae bacterium]|nr:Holliday junction branch migration protein RuvA [Rhodospirillaceae bacterium]MCY4311338.1 Holliday junction branch migration protein RuvA [Rhodospirillaceae bacterium]
MIGSLTGIIDTIGQHEAVINVGGVGYLIYASGRTLATLANGEAVKLLIETHVREDHIHLYGFADRTERDCFRLLTTVQGVGARVALALLTVLTTDALATAIAAQDRAAISQADGVGPKLAARIVSELKDKAGLVGRDPVVAAFTAGSDGAGNGAPGSAMADAISALVNLGYSRSDAFNVLSSIAPAASEEATVEQLIPLALQKLSA